MLAGKSRAQVVISKAVYYVGRFQWDVAVENNDACLTIGFGICQRNEIQRAVHDDIDLKEIKTKEYVSIIQANGTYTGGLRG